MQNNVILVNSSDQKIGLMPKLEAHIRGVLHRAFSVLIFNKKGELLIQQRALNKYHTPGLWSNTCCSHQIDGETNIEAGKRRLFEEMGFEVELFNFDSFIYNAYFENGLIEHEFDHILVGVFDGTPLINKNEVNDYKWISFDKLQKEIYSSPQNYTVWFRIIFEKYKLSLKKWISQ
tara:strand:+ start:1931 stop:2458 length:528 start_codon:yes stop_codon:yes gene_type:complete